MSAPMKPALCVVVHDVADARLAGCERVLAAVREVAPVALTLLAVPRFHHAAPTVAQMIMLISEATSPTVHQRFCVTYPVPK